MTSTRPASTPGRPQQQIGGDVSQDLNRTDDGKPRVYYHFGPHRNGLPPMRKYLRDLWHRRDFAVELSRANMRSSSSDTFFGQIWLILNPVLMAAVYYLLVDILSNRGNFEYFIHLTANLFIFTFVTTCTNNGATSVTTAGKLILNTNFPRLLIPLGAVHTAFMRFLPTLPVTLLLLIVNRDTIWSPKMLVALVFMALMMLFGCGLAAFFATAQVYFRDTNNFLPYVVRIWMYLSPVLWTVTMLDNHPTAQQLAPLNPMYSMLSGYSSLLLHGVFPDVTTWLIALAWSIGVFVAGSLFFISREREFAVRIF